VASFKTQKKLQTQISIQAESCEIPMYFSVSFASNFLTPWRSFYKSKIPLSAYDSFRYE
jgi:hypothetical protein